MPLEILDALDLAAAPLDAEALRDDTPKLATLSLTGVASAEQVLQRVATAVAKRLAAGHDLRVGVTTGMLEPPAAAGSLASELVGHSQNATRIAVVRGENVLHTLEQWHAAGEALRHHETDERLFDSRVEPIAAFAPAPCGLVRSAFSTGARAVAAPACEFTPCLQHEPSDEPSRRRVTVWFVDHYRLTEVVPAKLRESIGECSRALGQETPLTVTLAKTALATDGGASVALDVGCPDQRALAEFAERLSMRMPRAAASLVEQPSLASRIRRVLRPWHTDVEADLLEYDLDVRSAADWLAAFPPNEAP